MPRVTWSKLELAWQPQNQTNQTAAIGGTYWLYTLSYLRDGDDATLAPRTLNIQAYWNYCIMTHPGIGGQATIADEATAATWDVVNHWLSTPGDPGLYGANELARITAMYAARLTMPWTAGNPPYGATIDLISFPNAAGGDYYFSCPAVEQLVAQAQNQLTVSAGTSTSGTGSLDITGGTADSFSGGTTFSGTDLKSYEQANSPDFFNPQNSQPSISNSTTSASVIFPADWGTKLHITGYLPWSTDATAFTGVWAPIAAAAESWRVFFRAFILVISTFFFVKKVFDGLNTY